MLVNGKLVKSGTFTNTPRPFSAMILKLDKQIKRERSWTFFCQAKRATIILFLLVFTCYRLVLVSKLLVNRKDYFYVCTILNRY